MKIELGKTTNGNVISYDYIPYETRGILIQGISGSRKTSLLEEFLARSLNGDIKPQQIIFDKGPELARLRKYDENYLIIGDDGELPITVDTAFLLGTESRIHRQNMIIQMPYLKAEKDQNEFIDKFLEGMNSIKDPKFWLPTFVVIDEAQQFCGGDKSTSCRDAIVRLCSTGRKYGLTPILVTQGIKDLYIRAREQLDNRIIGFTMEPQSRAVAAELLMMEKSKSDCFIDLKNEPKGRFMTWGSAITSETLEFKLESTKYTHEQKFEVPPTPRKIHDLADKLRKKIDENSEISEETKTAGKINHLESRIKSIHDGIGLPYDLKAIEKAAKTKGWNDANARTITEINKLNYDNWKKGNFITRRIKKPCNIEVIENEVFKEHGTVLNLLKFRMNKN